MRLTIGNFHNYKGTCRSIRETKARSLIAEVEWHWLTLSFSHHRNIACLDIRMRPCARQGAKFSTHQERRRLISTYWKNISPWMSLDVSSMRLSKILQRPKCGCVPIWCYWLFACIWLYSRVTSIRMKTFKVQRSWLVCLQSHSDTLFLHFPFLPFLLLSASYCKEFFDFYRDQQ